MIRKAMQLAVMVLGLASPAFAQQGPPNVIIIDKGIAPTMTQLGQYDPPMPLPPPSKANHWNLACYTNRNSPGCTNFWSEVRFVLGPCRDFFGEPCLPHPNATGEGFFGMRGAWSNFFNGGDCTKFGTCR